MHRLPVLLRKKEPHGTHFRHIINQKMKAGAVRFRGRPTVSGFGSLKAGVQYPVWDQYGACIMSSTAKRIKTRKLPNIFNVLLMRCGSLLLAFHLLCFLGRRTNPYPSPSTIHIFNSFAFLYFDSFFVLPHQPSQLMHLMPLWRKLL